MTEISGLVFDKDGTLFDFHTTWSTWAHSFLTELAEGNLARAALFGDALGFNYEDAAFRRDSLVIAGTPGEIADVLLQHVQKFDRAALIDRMNEAASAAPLVPAVPLAPLLDNLRASGLRLGVATNDAEAPARAHLKAAGVLDRFDFIAGSDSGYGAKPDSGQLMAFAKMFALAPQTVVMVGDSRHDLVAGRAAGMQTVAVLTGVAVHDDLAPLADSVLADIGQLPYWIASRKSR